MIKSLYSDGSQISKITQTHKGKMAFPKYTLKANTAGVTINQDHRIVENPELERIYKDHQV